MVDTILSPSAETFDKDVEIQSLHSDSEIEEGITVTDGRTLTEKGDIEAYPDGVNQPQNEVYREAVTRTSTKSSWKDPGPPPDGGLSGWSQGSFSQPL